MTLENGLANAADADIELARRIVLDGLKGHPCAVFLFGSRATRTAGPASDLDVAIWPQQPLPLGLLAEIADALEESPILLTVDLVDLSGCDGAFRQRVVEEGIAWAA
jgi:uncharacterized protein